MRFQSERYSCGAASVGNAFLALGYRIREDHIMAAASTDEAGTDEAGMLAAIRHFGFVPTEHQTNSRRSAWDWLFGSLINGRPVILCLQEWSHWCTATGPLGNRVNIVDPSNYKYNVKENGIYVRSKKHLMDQWYYASQDLQAGEKRIYGISVGLKGK